MSTVISNVVAAAAAPTNTITALLVLAVLLPY